MEKILDTLVGGAEMLAEEAVFLARLRGHGGGDLCKFRIFLHRHQRAADEGEFDIDMGNKMRRQLAVHDLVNALSLLLTEGRLPCPHDANNRKLGKHFYAQAGEFDAVSARYIWHFRLVFGCYFR